MQQPTIRIKNGHLQKKFSEAFKKEVVRDYEQGLLNKD
jgi:transposase-like protein